MFYLKDGQLWAIEIETEPKLIWQDPVALFEAPWQLGAPSFLNYDVTPDGQRFVFVQSLRDQNEDRPNEIHVVLNWFEELKERVPVP